MLLSIPWRIAANLASLSFQGLSFTRTCLISTRLMESFLTLCDMESLHINFSKLVYEIIQLIIIISRLLQSNLLKPANFRNWCMLTRTDVYYNLSPMRVLLLTVLMTPLPTTSSQDLWLPCNRCPCVCFEVMFFLLITCFIVYNSFSITSCVLPQKGLLPQRRMQVMTPILQTSDSGLDLCLND